MLNYTLSVKAANSVNYYTVKCQFFAFNLEKLHRAEKIYTGTACGACDKYQVCKKYAKYAKYANSPSLEVSSLFLMGSILQSYRELNANDER